MTINDKMRLKIRLLVQSVSFILIFVGILCLSLREFKSEKDDKPFPRGSRGAIPSPEQPILWQERAPRSLKEDYDIQDNAIHHPKDQLTEETAQKTRQINNFEEQKKHDLLNTITATATAKPATVLDDIFISVKTTNRFHKTRLDLILKTWFNLAKEQTWFFSDLDDPEYQRKTGNHLIDTKCPPTHNRKALCCKMAREFDAFLESQKRWWCHFDDDNYVNIPALVSNLGSYDSQQDWYLGRPSINVPLEILNKDDLTQKISFWFATGGAGFCLSRSLALKMMPVAGGGKFISVGEKIRLPDDVTMGYIIEHLLRKKLTIVDGFHSHLEPMRFMDAKKDSLQNQISFGYSQYGSEMNVVQVEGLPERVDPTRMFSLHCKLFPSSPYCPR